MHVKENKRIKEYLRAEAQRTDGGDLDLGRKPYLLIFPPTYPQFFVLPPVTMDAQHCTFLRFCPLPHA
jgi:hypothetical protein